MRNLWKLSLVTLVVAIGVLVPGTASVGQDPILNLPVIVFRKVSGSQTVSPDGGLYQDKFCAAYRVEKENFLTAAHCLVTDSGNTLPNSLETVELGHLEIDSSLNTKYSSKSDPRDIAGFRYRDSHIAGMLSLAFGSGFDDSCSVVVLHDDLHWRILSAAQITRCSGNLSEDKICYTLDNATSGLDYAVVCSGNTVLKAIFYDRLGEELRFTDCAKKSCSDIIKSVHMQRVKRQDTGETKPEETKPEETKPEETKPEETKPEETKSEETKPEETKPEESKKDEPKTEEGGKGDSSASATSPDASKKDNAQKPTSGASDTKDKADSTSASGEIPLPPPDQLFPKMPVNFPYPDIEVVQSPPPPTKARKRPAFQGLYPGAPIMATMKPMTPQSMTPQSVTPLTETLLPETLLPVTPVPLDSSSILPGLMAIPTDPESVPSEDNSEADAGSMPSSAEGEAVPSSNDFAIPDYQESGSESMDGQNLSTEDTSNAFSNTDPPKPRNDQLDKKIPVNQERNGVHSPEDWRFPVSRRPGCKQQNSGISCPTASPGRFPGRATYPSPIMSAPGAIPTRPPLDGSFFPGSTDGSNSYPVQQRPGLATYPSPIMSAPGAMPTRPPIDGTNYPGAGYHPVVRPGSNVISCRPTNSQPGQPGPRSPVQKPTEKIPGIQKAVNKTESVKTQMKPTTKDDASSGVRTGFPMCTLLLGSALYALMKFID
ncbi:uncharacterized protein LOC131429613 [Malaya genurostris]|uniref:uncharacterized protein LOC131429613 n=1 Tax=Malaya genurostris TaxID=325434 RepID=UPI0026F3ACD5|nr:uncharacterized protein LOC131429613 [Malaya genurostris]